MISKNKKLILLNLLLLGLVIISCKSITSADKNKAYNQITTNITKCGSYEVKNNQETIGYAVKPYVVKVDRVKEITEFEQKLKTRHKDNFNKDYRAYAFTTDRAGDTILMISFLSSKQAENMPDWKCELQDVDAYPKNTEWVDYNCSKNRFKVLGDPD